MVPMFSKVLMITEGPTFSAKSEVPYALWETVCERMGKRTPERHTRGRRARRDGCSWKHQVAKETCCLRRIGFPGPSNVPSSTAGPNSLGALLHEWLGTAKELYLVRWETAFVKEGHNGGDIQFLAGSSDARSSLSPVSWVPNSRWTSELCLHTWEGIFLVCCCSWLNGSPEGDANYLFSVRNLFCLNYSNWRGLHHL